MSAPVKTPYMEAIHLFFSVECKCYGGWRCNRCTDLHKLSLAHSTAVWNANHLWYLEMHRILRDEGRWICKGY